MRHTGALDWSAGFANSDQLRRTTSFNVQTFSGCLR